MLAMTEFLADGIHDSDMMLRADAQGVEKGDGGVDVHQILSVNVS